MNKIFSRSVAFVLIVFILVFMTSCSPTNRRHSITFFDYFNTFSTLTVYADSAESFENYKVLFSDTLSKYHSLLDATRSIDGIRNIYYLNENAANEPVEIDQELTDFLIFAKETYSITSGYTNLAMGALTSIWKEALENKTLPSNDVLIEASQHINIDSLIIEQEKSTVSFSDPYLKLDAGAIAKGYVSKIIFDILVEAGCKSFLINLGGNLTAHGIKEDGKSWRGGIENPSNIEDIDKISINISERSISTSGSYNQSFELDNQRYHHIINPYTAYPQNSFISVSVISDNIAIADALSTALFSMSKIDGLSLIDSIDGAEAIWITYDGEYFTSNGLDKYKG